jgi:hypothetical protein
MDNPRPVNNPPLAVVAEPLLGHCYGKTTGEYVGKLIEVKRNVQIHVTEWESQYFFENLYGNIEKRLNENLVEVACMPIVTNNIPDTEIKLGHCYSLDSTGQQLGKHLRFENGSQLGESYGKLIFENGDVLYLKGSTFTEYQCPVPARSGCVVCGGKRKGKKTRRPKRKGKKTRRA